uniref:Peptidyl-prolyl cis-trans isomerase n=1 Tax=Octactis speculum TaxID=3111310 RepID=A0A7S2GX94_9STRA
MSMIVTLATLATASASRGKTPNLRVSADTTDDDTWATESHTCVSMEIVDYGTITIELADDQTPITVENFLTYVNSDFYDGLIFHRVIEDFMIQGGGYDAKFNEKATNAAIVDEAKTGLSNLRGTISMARTSKADSATDQFFINTVDNTYLDYSSKSDGYAAFGKVTDGMTIVDAISEVDTHTYKGNSDVPKTAIYIGAVTTVQCDASSTA